MGTVKRGTAVLIPAVWRAEGRHLYRYATVIPSAVHAKQEFGAATFWLVKGTLRGPITSRKGKQSSLGKDVPAYVISSGSFRPPPFSGLLQAYFPLISLWSTPLE